MHAEFLSLSSRINSIDMVHLDEIGNLQTDEVLEWDVEVSSASVGVESTKRAPFVKALEGNCKQMKLTPAEYEPMTQVLPEKWIDIEMLASESTVFDEFEQSLNEECHDEKPQETMKLCTELRDVTYDLQVSHLQGADVTPEAQNLPDALPTVHLSQTALQLYGIINVMRESALSQLSLDDLLAMSIPYASHNEGLDINGLASPVEQSPADVMQRLMMQENEVERVRTQHHSLQQLIASKGDSEECPNLQDFVGVSPAEIQLFMELKTVNQQRKQMVQELTVQMMSLSAQVAQNLDDTISMSKELASGLGEFLDMYFSASQRTNAFFVEDNVSSACPDDSAVSVSSFSS